MLALISCPSIISAFFCAFPMMVVKLELKIWYFSCSYGWCIDERKILRSPLVFFHVSRSWEIEGRFVGIFLSAFIFELWWFVLVFMLFCMLCKRKVRLQLLLHLSLVLFFCFYLYHGCDDWLGGLLVPSPSLPWARFLGEGKHIFCSRSCFLW